VKLSFKLIPCADEALSSWLIRISRKHYLNSKEFCDFHEMTKFWKEAMDIDSDLSQLNEVFEYNVRGINNVRTIINDFSWEKGRSQWLIEPNKKGVSLQNSFTQICPGCLSKMAYIQLKWKFNLFFGCSACGKKLIKRCPNCNRYISPLKADIHVRLSEDFHPFWNCLQCGFDLRSAIPDKLTNIEIEEIKKLETAYMETPSNIRYLKFKQFGTIEGLT